MAELILLRAIHAHSYETGQRRADVQLQMHWFNIFQAPGSVYISICEGYKVLADPPTPLSGAIADVKLAQFGEISDPLKVRIALKNTSESLKRFQVLHLFYIHSVKRLSCVPVTQ